MSIIVSMIAEIDIGTALNKLDQTYDERTNQVNVYGLKFLKADGSFREMRVKKNVKLSGRNQNRKQMQNLKEFGQILIYDVDDDQHKNIYVSTICAFRDDRSDNWLKVRH